MCWLSKGNMLIQLARLLPEANEFLEIQHKNKMKTDISDAMFQKRLTFLADTFTHLNELNRKLQGAGAKILLLRDNLFAFIAKLKLWKVAAFPTMNKLSCTNGVNIVIQSEAIDHFNCLIEEFYHYFPCVEQDTPVMALTRNLFRVSVEDLSNEQNEEEGQGIQEEFFDMIHDSTAKDYFKDESFENF